MRKGVTNLNQGQKRGKKSYKYWKAKGGKRVTNIGRQKDQNEKRGYKSQLQISMSDGKK